MLRFEAYNDQTQAGGIDLSGAYLFGQDGIPVCAELTGDGQSIICRKRIAGPVGLSLLWDAGASGRLMLGTARLPERTRPYNLNVELARSRTMRIARKIEEWGLFDYDDAEELIEEFEEARGLFVDSLKASDALEAASLADKSLELAVTLSEKIALFHADAFLDRRRRNQNASAARKRFGCRIDLTGTSQPQHDRLREAFDFLAIPMSWKQVEPQENTYRFTEVDTWINFAARAQKPIHVGPVIDFDPTNLPQWLYLWEHDYDSLREVIYKHLEQIMSRYARQARIWSVVSGLHAWNNFNLGFEQIMELTRMCCQLAKKLAPRSQIMIELVMPWGEYYARNQRTIPPQLYADMAVQSGIKFDAFGLQVYMGLPQDGHYVRDMMQISSLLDEFTSLRKPVHVTGCSVPSHITADGKDGWSGRMTPTRAGRWHAPWSQRLQAEWLQAFYRVCLSKPFVESICWRDLSDEPPHYIPHGGLMGSDAEPKLSFTELRNFRAFVASAERRIQRDTLNGDA
ncbi:MAG: endo-1,4-beta-xylanase [Planctomycetota bacterium]|jgi:GH35 family endo-1,4-beta-xylanase